MSSTTIKPKHQKNNKPRLLKKYPFQRAGFMVKLGCIGYSVLFCPRKKSATVPGPECAPMTGPIL